MQKTVRGAGAKLEDEGRWIAALVVISLGARLVFSSFLNTFNPDWTDFDTLARNLSAGNGFTLSVAAPFVPATIRDPLYPMMLSGIYTVFGANHAMVFLLQGILSTLNVVLIYLIGKDLFGARVGLAGGLWSAVYIPFLYMAADFLTETLYTFFILAAMVLALRSEKNRLVYLGAAGALLGLATLTRTDGLLYGVLFGAAIWFLAKDRRKTAVAVFAMLAVVGLTVSPWVWRNYATTGRIMLRDPSLIYAALRVGAGYPFSDPLYKLPFQYPGGMPESLRQEHQARVLSEYWRDLREKPVTLLSFRANQLVRLWMDSAQLLPLKEDPFFDLLRAGDYTTFALRAILFGFFGVLNLVGALVGVVIGVRRNRNSILLLILPVYITLLNIPIFASPTYSMPGRAMLMPFVGVTILVVLAKLRLMPAGETL